MRVIIPDWRNYLYKLFYTEYNSIRVSSGIVVCKGIEIENWEMVKMTVLVLVCRFRSDSDPEWEWRGGI